MDKTGRIVLPKSVRDRFRLAPGTKLSLTAVGDHLELTPVGEDSPTPMKRRKGLLIVAPTGRSTDAVAAIAADREDREDGLAGS